MAAKAFDCHIVAMGTIRTRILKEIISAKSGEVISLVAMGTIRTRILKVGANREMRVNACGRNGHDPHEDTERRGFDGCHKLNAEVAMGTIRTRILKVCTTEQCSHLLSLVAMGTIRTRILKDECLRLGYNVFSAVAMGTIRTRILKVDL